MRVVAKEEATVTPFEEVKDDIRRSSARSGSASAYEEYVEGLRKAARRRRARR